MDNFISNKPSLTTVLTEAQTKTDDLFDDDDNVETLPALIIKASHETDPLQKGHLLRLIDAFTGSRNATDALLFAAEPEGSRDHTHEDVSEFNAIILTKHSDGKNSIGRIKTDASAVVVPIPPMSKGNKLSAINHCEFIGGVVTHKAANSANNILPVYPKPGHDIILHEIVPSNAVEHKLETSRNIGQSNDILSVANTFDAHLKEITRTVNNVLTTDQNVNSSHPMSGYSGQDSIEKHQLKNAERHNTDIHKTSHSNAGDSIKTNNVHNSSIDASGHMRQSHSAPDITTSTLSSEINTGSLVGLVGFPVGYQNVPMKNFGALSVLQVLSCLVCAALSWKHVYDLGGTDFSSGLATGAIFVLNLFGSVCLVIGLVLSFFQFRYATVSILMASILCLPLYIYLTASAFSNALFFDHHVASSHPTVSWGAWGISGIIGFATMLYLYRMPDEAAKNLLKHQASLV